MDLALGGVQRKQTNKKKAFNQVQPQCKIKNLLGKKKIM